MALRVALIYGGVSGEHSVSCLTAASVMRAIDPEAYEVLPIAIAKNGMWVPGISDPDVLDGDGTGGEVLVGDTQIVLGMAGDHHAYAIGPHGTEDLGRIDVAFPLLHGPFGEDGTIQGMLEMSGIPYVGCGVFASSAGMDKHYMKVVLEAAGIPVAPYIPVTTRQWHSERDAIIERVAKELTFPVFVKPARAGSSLGIVKVDAIEALEAAVEAARATDPKVIIEQGVVGREIECAVLGGHGDEAPRASVVGEVVMDGVDWYDFDTKYVATEGFHMEIPAHVSEAESDAMRAMAVSVFDAFECEGLTRVDFWLTDEGEILVNEHNTIPGFTAFSMYPILWENTGLPYGKLIDELISLACERPVGLR